MTGTATAAVAMAAAAVSAAVAIVAAPDVVPCQMCVSYFYPGVYSPERFAVVPQDHYDAMAATLTVWELEPRATCEGF